MKDVTGAITKTISVGAKRRGLEGYKRKYPQHKASKTADGSSTLQICMNVPGAGTRPVVKSVAEINRPMQKSVGALILLSIGRRVI